MTAIVKHSVRRVYHQHGLLAFLLFFVPLLPGFVEHHTLAYINLIERLVGTPVNPHDPAVRTIFGHRGHHTLRSRQHQAKPIYTKDISQAFFVHHQPEVALSLVQKLFFDQRLRQLPHSDVVRSQVIGLLPQLFSIYDQPSQQLFRSTFIRQIAWLSLSDLSLEPRQTTITVFTQLLHQVSATEQLRHQHRLNQEMALLEMKMKGELAGRSTVLDPDFVRFDDALPVKTHVVTQDDINRMTKTLKRLTQVSAPEIALAAHTSLNGLKAATLQLS